MIKYNVQFTFSDPFDTLFNHKEILQLTLPESTYVVVKKNSFESLSNKKIDLPKEYTNIQFEIIHEERL